MTRNALILLVVLAIARPAGADVSTITSGHSTAAHHLAGASPESERVAKEKEYDELLRSWGTIESTFKYTAGDAANAAMMMVISSYAAYNATTVDGKIWPLVIQQLRPVFAKDPVFVKATPAQRRFLYERMAILAMIVGTADHDEARRKLAKSFLEEFGFDADTLRISAKGLSALPKGPPLGSKR